MLGWVPRGRPAGLLIITIRSSITYYRGHTNPPHPHTSDLINVNDLDCSEEHSVLRAFSELLHLISSNLNLLNGWWWGWGGFVWSQYYNLTMYNYHLYNIWFDTNCYSNSTSIIYIYIYISISISIIIMISIRIIIISIIIHEVNLFIIDMVVMIRGNHMSNTTCLTHCFFKRGESCTKLW